MTRAFAVVLALMLALSSAFGCHRGRDLLAHDGTPVPIPHNLEQAMDALDRLLEPELIEALRSGEVDPIQLHHGLGTWLRNYWGLWAGWSLARWFRVRGIFHPDDMSAIVLESYTRRLQGQPIELRAQIAYYKRYWAEQKAFREAELAAGPERAARVEAMRMGWTFADREVPSLPAITDLERTDNSVPVARLEHYAGGVLVFGGHVYGEPQQLWPKWHTGVYYLADPDAELERVRRDDCEQIHDALTLGETTHWLCRNGEAFWIVLDERAGETPFRSIDVDAEFLRLGSHGDELLVISSRAIYRFDRDAWRPVYEHDQAWFPAEASVPRQLGHHLFYLAPHHYDDVVLTRMDLRDTAMPDQNWWWDLSRQYYGQWSNQFYMVAPSSDGGLWLTAGHRFRSTLFWLSPDTVELAVFAGSVDRPAEYEEGLLQHDELDEAEFRRQIPASAVLERDGVVYLADELGISVSRGGRVEPLVRFEVPYRELRTATRSSGGSHGPWGLALFPGTQPSFALDVGEVVVVRASEDGYELRKPKRTTVAIMK